MANIVVSCSLAKGHSKEDNCAYSLNKVINVYLADYATSSAEVTGHTVTGVTGTWYLFEPAKDSASFTDELQVLDSGAKYRTHTISFAIDGVYNDETADLIDTLSLGRFRAVAELANGNWIMLGRVAPLEASVQTVTGAASASDATAYEVTLVADVTETVSPLNEAAISKVKGGA